METKKIIEELLLERDAEMVRYSTDEAIKSHKERCDYLIELLEKQEQGLLVELPCKVGDTVWCVANPHVIDYEVNGFLIDNTGKLCCIYAIKRIDGRTYENTLYYPDYKSSWFLARSEAEEALARLKEAQNENN